jgi:methyl-accepting chemotaxis protein
LFAMGWIVDRIVSVDAPVATLAERVSIEMLDARRAERNYFLLYDNGDLEANRDSLKNLTQILGTIRQLQPQEAAAVDKIQTQVEFYRHRMEDAVSRHGEANEPPVDYLRNVVRAYTKDLDNLLKHAARDRPARLVEELHNRLGSLDAQVSATLEAQDPAFRQITDDLRTSSSSVEQLATDLENRSWERVNRDHARARGLIRRAEWVLSIVSGMTILLSIWVSFLLPRTVVKPLADLKSAVDQAAAGDYAIEFDVEGQAEVVQLANSVRNLISHVREKERDVHRSAKP